MFGGAEGSRVHCCFPLKMHHMIHHSFPLMLHVHDAKCTTHEKSLHALVYVSILRVIVI